MMTLDPLKKYNVRLAGNPTADKTLVFAHGFGSDQSTWRFITPAFQAQYRLVLFDLAGCGGAKMDESEKLRHGSLQDYAEDLIQICDALQLKQVDLIAHSVSSMIGTLATIKRPDLFASLVFIGASPRYLNDKGYFGGFSQDDVTTILGEISNNYLSWARTYAPAIMNASNKPFLSEEFARTLTRLRPDVALVIFSMIILSDYRREVSQLELPVLILQAQDDLFAPNQVGEYLHRTIKISEICWMSGKGHFPHMTNPTEIIEAIARFFNKKGR